MTLAQDFASSGGGKKILSRIPVRKPNALEFFRSHPEHRFDTALFMDKAQGESWLVVPELWDALPRELVRVTLALVVTRQATSLFWPLRLPDADGTLNSWHESARHAVDVGGSTWIRVQANKDIDGYDILPAVSNLIEPSWPTESLDALIDIAFRRKIVDGWDHPVLRRLRGEL